METSHREILEGVEISRGRATVGSKIRLANGGIITLAIYNSSSD